ncbi:MAG: bifunctional (p)ppGpp synthetase/guanosine-3',5'-bis(diphosphate) 3'-pyrophosphohydrolase [Oscillospiraceae bacterium]|nr:bifunctional (p)ppGpp synthetase/guanosine-3',5'-bis(diphosphate) 3'-pyrophosphohydrolase [Oscillospiraceae bacterium]
MESDYRAILETRYQSLISALREYMPALDEKRLLDAFEFAAAAHSGQFRRSGEPYVIHPVEVALIIVGMNMDLDSVIAALLHDVLEDTRHTFADIRDRFGLPVAELVEGVTKLTRVHYASKEDEQMENLRKMFLAMARDIRVIVVKIADRLHNMRTIAYMTERRRKEISQETMEIYAPLAHRLGMQRIKWELEDVALLELDPFGYTEITREMETLQHTHIAFLSQIREQIEARLHKENIPGAHIESRVKHIYSLYRKMMGQNKKLPEIYDLYAVRIIVDDAPECYNVLGIMHDEYKSIPGRFKDYISTPKPNMYQSLHTTVIGKEGQPFEIQIRTWHMHRTAEFGIAAHWRYKQGLKDAVQPPLSEETHLEWVRGLLESQQDTEAEEFIRGIKHEMFADEVFVLTPRGDVISLPAGAGPVDFAYAIHSEVGNKLSGAKVNGRIVPLDYKLESGEVTEILTSNAHGPSRDWIKLVKTSMARNKIKQWFKKERREENIQQGRAELERELKRAGIAMSAVMHEDILTPSLKKLSFGTPDDMLAAVGYGGVSVRRVLSRFREELTRQARLRATDESVTEQVAAAAQARKPKKAISGVIVDELDNCQIKFARCCAPVPGDHIEGYVTRGSGVSIHRSDCPNIHDALRKETGRRVSVSWADTIYDSYESGLAIHCSDRTGLVVDVMNALGGFKTKVSSLHARIVGDGDTLVTLRLEVTDLDQLTHIINRITQIPNVKDIQRKEV